MVNCIKILWMRACENLQISLNTCNFFISFIFKLQKRVIRIISGVDRLSSCRQHFKELDLLPLPCMYIFELVYYIKSHFGELDQNSAVHNHNTRQKLNLHVQFCRTNVEKNGVMNMGIRLYNRIPN
jgi:hypothetical protein